MTRSYREVELRVSSTFSVDPAIDYFFLDRTTNKVPSLRRRDASEISSLFVFLFLHPRLPGMLDKELDQEVKSKKTP